MLETMEQLKKSDNLQRVASRHRRRAATFYAGELSRCAVKARLHRIHVAGQATCIRIQVDTCRRDNNFVANTGYM